MELRITLLLTVFLSLVMAGQKRQRGLKLRHSRAMEMEDAFCELEMNCKVRFFCDKWLLSLYYRAQSMRHFVKVRDSV